MAKKEDFRMLKKIILCFILWILVSGQTEGGGGCGCSEDVTSPGERNIILSATSLDFEETAVGMFSIQPLIIGNLNEYDVTIQNVTSSNNVFRIGEFYSDSRLTPLTLPFTITGNSERTIYIGFYPQKPEEYSESLIIESVDVSEQEPRVQTDTVDLSGVGVL